LVPLPDHETVNWTSQKIDFVVCATNLNYTIGVLKPTLTIVTRLGGEGFSEIYDLQLCLAGQSDKNFTWIILLRPSAHDLDSDLRLMLKKTPELWLRTKVIKCDTDNRSKLLNKSLSQTRDDYLVVFDDDDLPLSNFVKVIREAASESKSTAIVRTEVVEIATERLRLNSGYTQIQRSKANFLWPSTFNRLDHLQQNLTPCMAVSYPVSLLRKNELQWDEELHAVEDWDFLMRSSEIIPVVSPQVVTSIYRRSGIEYRSQLSVHPRDWINSERIVRAKLEKIKFIVTGSELLSRGSVITIQHRTLSSQIAEYYVKLVHKFRPFFTRTPRLYLLLKQLHKFLIKVMRMQPYV
jgi:hypothetical protein